MAGQDKLLLFCSMGTEKVQLYEGQVSENTPGILTYTKRSLPDSFGGYGPICTVWDKNGELLACQYSGVVDGGYSMDHVFFCDDILFHRFQKYLTLSSSHRVAYRGDMPLSMVICKDALYMAYNNMSLQPSPDRYLIRRRGDTFSRVQFNPGKIIDGAISIKPKLFYPDGANFQYVYNLQLALHEQQIRLYIETISCENFAKLDQDSDLAWTRFGLDMKSDDERTVFKAPSFRAVPPQGLMLFDEHAKKYWLYVFVMLENFHIAYFRTSPRDDGSLQAIQPDSTVSISDFKSLDVSWTTLVSDDTSGEPVWGVVGQPALSVVTFADRVWMFFGDGSGGRSYSCPMPKDGKLPDDVNGWTKNTASLPHIPRTKPAKEQQQFYTSYWPAKVPASFLG